MAIEEDETLTMYVQESKEHLETIESDLLEIEQGGEAIDEDLVNKVFRAAHSIKGGGSFLGLDHIKELSHKIENVLDMVRNFQLVPSPGLIDTVLKAFDRLGELLDDVLSSNEMEIDDHVTALKEIVTHSMSEAEKSTMDQVTEVNIQAEGPCFKISQFDLNQARRGGKDLYLLEIDLINDVQRQEKTPLDLISSLADVGVILDNLINIDVVGDLDSDEIATVLPMFVLYASVVEPDLLGTLLGLESSKVTLVPKGQEDSHAKIVVSTEDSKDSKKPQAKRAKTKAVKVKASKAKVSGKKEAANIKASENKEAEKKVAVKKPVPEKQPSQNSASPPKTLAKSENLRVPVAVLDQLMNRAGELVLARNELLQAISGEDKKTMLAAGQRINMVTSELQEAIMLTRMQPVGSIFNKFTRVVRDMASDLDKQMSLTIEGSEVELDKSIIEGLGDPLTHLVRNSCDHGIEKPGPRADKGKPTNGKISLRAFHESGQVIIEIEDDGKGLDADKLAEKAISKGMCTEEQVSLMSDKEKTNLIMLPGFSTAETVSDISGRGVGMDVVKTNLDQLGGQVELISEVDKGTTVRIKLPLTLAIIPSLLVENNGERFALPQVNVGELLRIPAAEIRERIEKVGEADVLILRGELIPLLQLNNVLELDQTYY
ncbi:MAG: chemotaxis protein CheA, partial [Deltaproteobacteria bacterium]|nr:chemotaxis protein CheA [Deltaproteobacteria bacterium]